jgi:hypothetical protein
MFPNIGKTIIVNTDGDNCTRSYLFAKTIIEKIGLFPNNGIKIL